MKKLLSVILILGAAFLLAACEPSETVKCGAGTVLKDGSCVAPENDEETDICGEGTTLVEGTCVLDEEDPLVCDEGYHEENGACVEDEEPVVCDEGYHEENGACVEDEDPLVCDEGYHEENGACVEDEEPLVCDEGYHEENGACVEDEVVDDAPANALEKLANIDFADSDLSAWSIEGNVALSHDASGYLVANVSSFTGQFYEENFLIRNLVTQSGYTYTVSFVAKTDVAGGRDVQFFLEDTDAGYAKYFLETETLTSDFQTFTYTYVATTTNNDTTLGVFVGEMVNAGLGNVIIDEIIIVKESGLVGTKVEEMLNSDFTDSDISNWVTEGNVALTHDANGYLVIDVTAFTGNFWEENVTYGDLIAEGWTNYTITVVIKGTVERDVILFAEDTDNGFEKYADVTFTVTTEWTTVELTFRPLVDNADTKIGFFFGTMDNAEAGQFMIDSITITAEPTFD